MELLLTKRLRKNDGKDGLGLHHLSQRLIAVPEPPESGRVGRTASKSISINPPRSPAGSTTCTVVYADLFGWSFFRRTGNIRPSLRRCPSCRLARDRRLGTHASSSHRLGFTPIPPRERSVSSRTSRSSSNYKDYPTIHSHRACLFGPTLSIAIV
jgi:hypothetical protein